MNTDKVVQGFTEELMKIAKEGASMGVKGLKKGFPTLREKDKETKVSP